MIIAINRSSLQVAAERCLFEVKIFRNMLGLKLHGIFMTASLMDNIIIKLGLYPDSQNQFCFQSAIGSPDGWNAISSCGGYMAVPRSLKCDKGIKCTKSLKLLHHTSVMDFKIEDA